MNSGHTFVFDFDLTIVTTTTAHDLWTEAASKVGLEKEMHDIILDASKRIHNPGICNIILPKAEKINIRMTIDVLNNVRERIAKQITPGIEKVISKLIKDGHQVFVIGGGYGGCDIMPSILKQFGVPEKNVFSDTKLDLSGSINYTRDPGYARCSTNNVLIKDPKWRKSRIIKKLKQDGLMKGTVVHIGDGANDLEVWQSGEVDHFIGFGVNRIVPKVQQEAEIFVKDMDEFKKVIKKLVSN